MSDSQNGKPHWTVDRRVNIGNLVTTFVFVITAVVWFVRLEGQVESNKDNISNNAREIERSEGRQMTTIYAVESRQNSKFSEIKTLLQRIDDKLDRKADK